MSLEIQVYSGCGSEGFRLVLCTEGSCGSGALFSCSDGDSGGAAKLSSASDKAEDALREDVDKSPDGAAEITGREDVEEESEGPEEEDGESDDEEGIASSVVLIPAIFPDFSASMLWEKLKEGLNWLSMPKAKQ